MNAESSRSHSILQIAIENTVDKDVIVSRLQLCDLAGSEKIKM